MKKAIVVLLALAFVGAMAFADDAKTAVSFTGAVKAGAKIVIPNSGDPTLQQYDNDNGSQGYAKMNLGASLGDFSANFYLISTDFVAWTIPNAWVTEKFLNDMLEVRAGVIDNGAVGTVNKGYGGLSGAGIQVLVMPISGLTIGALIPAPLVDATTGAAATISQAFNLFRVGAAYKMADMFELDMTFIASAAAFNAASTTPEFDAGINVLAVKNLTAQLEANIGVYTNAPINIFENVAYALGDLTVGANALETLQSGADTVIVVTPNVSYKLGAIPTVSAQVAYTIGGTAANTIAPRINLGLAFNSMATLNIRWDGSFVSGSSSNTINVDFIHSF